MTAAAALDDGPFSGGVWRSEEFRMQGKEREFLYEFGMGRTEASSPVESIGSEESEEDEFFAMLTQRLSLCEFRNVSPSPDLRKSSEGLKVSGGSPQSTLGGIGSWSGRSSNGSSHNSPPATPFDSEEYTSGLIHAAAGQVDRLERNVEDSLQAAVNGQWRAVTKPKQVPLQNPNAIICADLQMKQKYIAAAARQANEAALFWEQHLHNMKIISRNVACSAMSNQSARPCLPQGRAAVKPNFQAIPLQRKESAGTGVFIPRRYEPPSPLHQRKRTVTPCALVPAKVVQALNTSIETMSSTQTHCNTSSNQLTYDELMARKRALLDQQQRSTSKLTEDVSYRSIEACLPQEWSY